MLFWRPSLFMLVILNCFSGMMRTVANSRCQSVCSKFLRAEETARANKRKGQHLCSASRDGTLPEEGDKKFNLKRADKAFTWIEEYFDKFLEALKAEGQKYQWHPEWADPKKYDPNSARSVATACTNPLFATLNLPRQTPHLSHRDFYQNLNGATQPAAAAQGAATPVIASRHDDQCSAAPGAPRRGQ